jgi:hypothetical protein
MLAVMGTSRLICAPATGLASGEEVAKGEAALAAAEGKVSALEKDFYAAYPLAKEAEARRAEVRERKGYSPVKEVREYFAQQADGGKAARERYGTVRMEWSSIAGGVLLHRPVVEAVMKKLVEGNEPLLSKLVSDLREAKAALTEAEWKDPTVVWAAWRGMRAGAEPEMKKRYEERVKALELPAFVVTAAQEAEEVQEEAELLDLYLEQVTPKELVMARTKARDLKGVVWRLKGGAATQERAIP